MSVALVDLGQRLRAAALGRPVARCRYAPVLPPVEPLAVTVSRADDRMVVQASDGLRLETAGGPDALVALAELGVALGPEPRTLVIPDRGTLGRLVELARASDPAAVPAAAVVGWWDQRADHPGTGAVLDLTTACAARWVLGVPPADEKHLAVWRGWLGVADAGAGGLLELAAAVAAGPSLPGLEAFTELDRGSWAYFVRRATDATRSWDWRARDNRREAALGLASRCDAAELYESLRLGDPLVATREAFGGTVVSGLVTAVPAQGRLEVTLERLACRLREDAAVEGYPGQPRDVPAAGGQPWLRGRVSATRVTPDERLVLSLDDVLVRSGPPRRGQQVTLRPRAVDPNQQRNGRHELGRRYSAQRSWLAGGPAPVARRREVPLDVAVAAADA